MIIYEITSDDLVQLIALACAHAITEERAVNPAEAAAVDQLLDDATEILKRTGVRYPSKFWDRCSRALEAQLHLSEPTTNPGSPDDPYLWESGT